MKRFVISSAKLPGDIVLEYNIDGNLLRAEFPEDMTVEQVMFFHKTFPTHVAILDEMKVRFKLNVTEVRDYSFEAFWEAYKHKVGSKDMVIQYWEGYKKSINKRPISELDREQIMSILPRYVKKYASKPDFQPMPQTFLHQRLWVAEYENTFKDVHNHPHFDAVAKRIRENFKT